MMQPELQSPCFKQQKVIGHDEKAPSPEQQSMTLTKTILPKADEASCSEQSVHEQSEIDSLNFTQSERRFLKNFPYGNI